VRDRRTGDGVQKEYFRPRRSATVGRVDLDFCKHFVEGCEILGLFLEEPPKPVLEHGVRVFTVAGKPRVAHRTMQVLLFVGQNIPFNNREHDDPHVWGPNLFKNPVSKEKKVPGVFDIYLAGGGYSEQRCDFKQFGAECGGHDKSCAEVIRHRRRCDLPWATDRGAAECFSAHSVFYLYDFVLVCVLAATSHGVCTCAGGHVSVARVGAVVPTGTGEAQDTAVRTPRSTREEKRRLPTWMPGRRVPCWSSADRVS
jgi:hypothetical protein